MTREALEQVIERIKYIEMCFDLLRERPHEMHTDLELAKCLQQLREYFGSPQWLQDYELDEQGLLPKDLKRGVLSQDAVYNFLEEWEC